MRSVFVLLMIMLFGVCFSVQAQQATNRTVKKTTPSKTVRTTKKKPPTKKPLNLKKELDQIKNDIKLLKESNNNLQGKLQGAGSDLFENLNIQIGELDSSIYTLQMANSTVRIAMDSMITVKFSEIAMKDEKTKKRIDELVENNERLSSIIIFLGISVIGTIFLMIILFLVLKYRFGRKNRVIIRYLKRLRTDLNQHIDNRRNHLGI